MLLTSALLVVITNTTSQKQHVSTLTFELDRRLKVGLLLRFLYGYNPVCFLKPATPLRLPARLN